MTTERDGAALVRGADGALYRVFARNCERMETNAAQGLVSSEALAKLLHVDVNQNDVSARVTVDPGDHRSARVFVDPGDHRSARVFVDPGDHCSARVFVNPGEF